MMNKLPVVEGEVIPIEMEIVPQRGLIRELSEEEKRWFLRFFPIAAFVFYCLFYLSPFAVYAQVANTFQQAATTVETTVRTIAGVSIGMLMAIGFFFFMFSGFSDTVRRNSIRIIGAVVVGSIGLFLFATPFSQFLVQTFNIGTGTGG